MSDKPLPFYPPGPDERCYACGRRLGRNPLLVDTRDEQRVFIGSECAKHVMAAGDAGWQPPKGGPRLFPLPTAPAAPAGQEEVARIARERLGIETLEARGRDALDFHSLGVDNIRAALLAAFEAGRAARIA